MTLRAANSADFEMVRRLLSACALPDGGLADQFGPGYVVAERGGSLAGVAGIEIHGGCGLLRSVAVEPGERGHGLGQTLVRNRLEWAEAQGLRVVYLLTTTAPAYFVKFGFLPLKRECVPAEVQASIEFSSACPSSATVLFRTTIALSAPAER